MTNALLFALVDAVLFEQASLWRGRRASDREMARRDWFLVSSGNFAACNALLGWWRSTWAGGGA